MLDDERDFTICPLKKIHDYQASCIYVMKQYLQSEAVNIKNRYKDYLLGLIHNILRW